MKELQKIFMALRVISIVFLFAGCTQVQQFPPLPEGAIEFSSEVFIDENNDDAMYGIIEYDGRKYAPFGARNNKCSICDMIDQCLGYTIQDGLADESNRIFTVQDDENHNFLMEYYVASTLMNEPMFYRAVDTAGEDVHIPYFIDSLEYEMWDSVFSAYK